MAGDNAKPETGAPSRVTGSALRPEAPGSGDDGQGEVAARPDGSAGGSLVLAFAASERLDLVLDRHVCGRRGHGRRLRSGGRRWLYPAAGLSGRDQAPRAVESRGLWPFAYDRSHLAGRPEVQRRIDRCQHD
jgi:hypothetical protein